MGNTFFRFKQFEVHQEMAAMKVGVDSVMLGAWVNVKNMRQVLDIGTGTGLLALMMAQRASDIVIDAIDIEPEACQQAIYNVKHSPWNDRIRIFCDDFRNFSANEVSLKYDLLISNPPYFTASLKTQHEQRNIARHNDYLQAADILSGAAKLLLPDGVLAVILPVTETTAFIAEAEKHSFFVYRKLLVQSCPEKSPYRILLELSMNPSTELKEEYLCIESQDRNGYSEAYKQLTGAFYLNF